jgi:serine/threonine protein kinase
MIIDEEGTVKLVDFCLAAPIDQFEHSTFVGTGEYISPEMHRVDKRGDENIVYDETTVCWSGAIVAQILLDGDDASVLT